jgi:hypothetical protein
MVRCLSCGGVRTPDQMQRAIDFGWRPIPGEFVCRDAGLCFHSMRARGFDTGRLTADGLGRIVKTVVIGEED